MMIYVLVFVLGFICSNALFIFRYKNGELKMTDTKETDYYTLFVDNMDRINKRKYLLLKVNKTTRK